MYDQGDGDRYGKKRAETRLEANNIAFDILNSDRTPTDDDVLEASAASHVEVPSPAEMSARAPTEPTDLTDLSSAGEQLI